MVSLPARRPPGVALRGARGFGGRLAALLGAGFFFLFGKVAGALDAAVPAQRCVAAQRARLRPSFFVQPPRGFLFGTPAGVLFRRLAGFFFGFAFFRGIALAPHALFFDPTAGGIFFGALAQFFFGELRVGEGAHPRLFLVLGQFAQNHSATAGGRTARLLAGVYGRMQSLLGGGVFCGRLFRGCFGLGRAYTRGQADALLLHHDRFAAAMAEALTNRRGFRALQRQSLAATSTPARSRTAVIRLAHSILSRT